MNNSKTILVFFFLMAGTLLTTTAVTTMVPAAYAGGDNDDGNKQKAEDDSSAGIADCDRNDVEEARFLCIAIAANGVEIEPPEEEPPEETATLSVCKVEASEAFEPEDFTFTVEGNNPDPEVFVGDNEDLCVDVDIGPGEYAVTETQTSGPPPGTIFIETPSNCFQESNPGELPNTATGEIEAGGTERCTFVNGLPAD
jgi:hypothetical protein